MKTASQAHRTTAGIWFRFAPPKFLLHCVPQKLHIPAERCKPYRSAFKIIGRPALKKGVIMPSGLVSKASECAISEVKSLGVMEQLVNKRDRLHEQIAEVEDTIAMFEKHPEFEQCLTQLSRCGIYR